ncbi:hypothetical protein FOA43_003963 [Brettanomyces nanus]|uniref:Uncharacterized protein n=1 Tax=Eeniella nana TaxID=13502 RepID=A0A875S9S9_EENNA|nr:uncharacterized protein FOA43_003963 [Brettanomyces nanus]QPG76572.1 hypothetical protein FOA43_003963 [Brettanomyces nanus]
MDANQDTVRQMHGIAPGVSTPQFMNSLIKTLELMGVKGPSNPSAAQVAYRLTKLVTAEKRVMRKEKDYFNSISNWVNGLPNHENSRLLVEFNRLTDIRIRTQEELVRKQENINLQLSHVFQREHKVETQMAKRTNTQEVLRDEERKKGEGQSIHLAREKLEEIDASIEVINEQMIKAINTSLKKAFIDYVICLQTSCNRLEEGCDEFFEYVNSGTSVYSLNNNLETNLEKIQQISTSRNSSENKENRLKDRASDFKIRNHGEIREEREIQEDDDIAAKTNYVTEENACTQCNALLKEGKVVHASFCSQFKKVAAERPESSQSISMPGRMSLRIPSLLRPREATVWQ